MVELSPMEISDRIAISPNRYGGKPVIKGTRLNVEYILDLLAEGRTYDEICREYEIEHEDILTDLQYTRKIVNQEDIFLCSTE